MVRCAMKRSILSGGIILGLLVLSAPRFCGEEPVRGTVWIEDVTVIDGTGASPLPHRNVLIEEGWITGIYPVDESPLIEAEVRIDGRGEFLLPGLIDMHTHLLDLSVAGLFLPYGVTTVRDVGTPYEEIDRLLAGIEASGLAAPRILYAGGWIDGFPPSWPDSHILVDPAQAAPLVEELADAGVSVLKIYNNLTLDPLFDLVESAREKGLHVTADILFSTEIDASEGIEAGVKGLEHSSGIVQWVYRDWIEANGSENEYFFGLGTLDTWPDYDEARLEDLFSRMIDRGVYLTPTFIIVRQIALLPDPPYDEEAAAHLSPKAKEYWYRLGYYTMSPLMENLLAFSQEVTRRYFEMGGRVIAGSDTPFPFVVPGTSLHQELELMVASGIPPLAVIHGATGAAAGVLGRDDLGEVAVGKRADLLLLAGDPVADIANTRQIAWVIHDGRPDRPEELLAELPRKVAASGVPGSAAHLCAFERLLESDRGSSPPSSR